MQNFNINFYVCDLALKIISRGGDGADFYCVSV